MKEKESKTSFGGYFLWILFPPYGIYKLFRTKSKWYIKIPIILILSLFTILAVDQTLNPNRVEDMEAREAITQYIAELEPGSNEDMGEVRKVYRVGAFVWDDNTKIVYRTLTKKGLYNFVIESKGNGDKGYRIDSIYEDHPITRWIKEPKAEYPALPMAMVHFQNNIETLGTVQKDASNEDSYAIKTDKGVYEYNYQHNGVTAVFNDKGEAVLEEGQDLLPGRVMRYIEKDEKKFGKEINVVKYVFSELSEVFHIQTETGMYRIDVMDNGEINFLEALDE